MPQRHAGCRHDSMLRTVSSAALRGISADQLQEAWETGSLVRPSQQKPDLVHLVRALATLGGMRGFEPAPAMRMMMDLIGEADHYVFILLDGLGMSTINRLPAGSFIASHVRAHITAGCPSTTAAALTSVATGFWPNRHAITGWFTYLPEFDISCCILPFVERFTQQSLSQRGLEIRDILPLHAFNPKMTHQSLTLLPAAIVNTAYASYSRGYTPGAGYTSVSNAVDQVITHVLSNGPPSHVHVYVPDIDTMCHKVGVDHPNVVSLVMQIDGEVARLAEALRGRARIVLTADHGLINVPHADQTILLEGDLMLSLLRVPPTGDGRMPIFHLREGKMEEFLDLFHQRFADRIALIDIDEAERLHLFGPGNMSPVARSRFGDFIGIPFKPVTLSYHPPDKPLHHLYDAQHGGLSAEEMTIPVCIA